MVELNGRRKKTTIVFARRLAAWLDLKRDVPKDATLLRFCSLTFSKCLAYLGERAEAGQWPPSRYECGWVADKALKAITAWKQWQGPSTDQVSKFFKLLVKVLKILVREYR